MLVRYLLLHNLENNSRSCIWAIPLYLDQITENKGQVFAGVWGISQWAYFKARLGEWGDASLSFPRSC